MKERPIIFNAEMIRAILEGRKTMTRRVIKPQPKSYTGQNIHKDQIILWQWKIEKGGFGGCPEYNIGRWIANSGLCPYGQAGDRLWVRETWYQNPATDKLVYKADYDHPISPAKWRPSIHMFRWASRINREITEVRVEQLMKIDIRDIHAEGIRLPEDKVGYYGKLYVDAFHNLWDSLNAKRSYSWESNPWVWVISFRG